MADNFNPGAVGPDPDLDSDTDSESKSADGSDQAIIEEALERFKLIEDAEIDIRAEALDDLKFAAGDQWDPAIKAARERNRRPSFTINRLPQHIKQVTNDQRQNRPSIKVHPVDDQADVETAKALSGIIRHIEYNSNADAAYDTGFEGAVRGGLGYWRVITGYVSPISFEQEILIKRIANRFSVFLDPFAKEPDGSDANFGFIVEDLPRDQYLAQFPDSKLAQIGEWESIGNSAPGWMGEKSARIAEYFYKELRPATLVLLNNGQVVLKSELPKQLPEGIRIVQERRTLIPAIKWVKMNACEILEKTDWLGSFIPIIPVYGEELDIDGKKILKGIVRDAKDPQKLVNYWKSAEAETIALAPKAPWIVEETQIEGFEADWETANTENHAFLKYRARAINGTPIPPPQRQAFEPATQAITMAGREAVDDLKATTGIFDPSLGIQRSDQSGVAIQRLNVQAQTGNFHYVDNLTRALRHTGRILVELIPKIYDTARVARIIGEDGQVDIIKVNQPFEKDGQIVTYDLSAGKYDVTVDVGPSYASKRQEAAASMMDFARAVPAVQQAAPDLIARNMDWPGAQELADRLKKTLPPQLQDDGKQAQIPPQVQAQMQQMSAMVDQLTQHLHATQDQLDQKKLELESKERIEMAKIQAEIEITMAKLGSQESIELLNQEIAQIERRLELLKFSAPLESESQEPEDQASPLPAGGSSALGGAQGAPIPTGGASPGSPMEGNSP